MPKHPTPSLPSSTSSPSARDQEGWEIGTETRVDDSGNITCSAPKKKVEHGYPALSPYPEGNYTWKPAPRGIEPPRGCRYDYCTPRTSAGVTEAESGRLFPGLGARRVEGSLDIDDGWGKERITDTKKRDTNKKREKRDPNDNSKVNGGSKTSEKVELASQLPRSTFSDDDDDDDDGRGKERTNDTKKRDTNKKCEKQDSNDNSKVNGGSKTTEKVELASQPPRATFSDDDDDEDDDNEGCRYC